MNKDRRRRLLTIMRQADILLEQLQGLQEEEQEAIDNTPEGLQCTDRFADIEVAAEAMAEAADAMRDIISSLEGIV